MRNSFTGNIINGTFIPDNIDEYRSFIKTLDRVEVTVGEYKATRSGQQNRYYWGKVVKTISDELGYDKEEVHSILSSKFLKDYKEIKEGETIKRYTVVRSTQSLDSEEMSIYIEECKTFASRELGIYLPD